MPGQPTRKFPRPRIDLSHLWRREPFGRNQRRAQRKLERKLLLQTLRAFRQRFEQFLRLCEMGDGFRVRRAPHRFLGRSLKIGNCGFPKIGTSIVVCEELRLPLHDV